MKRFIILSTLFVLIVSACGTSTPTTSAALPTSASLTVIVVDADHMQKQDLAYEIPAGMGFILDASKYDFGIPGGPTALQVVVGSRSYQAPWTSGATSQTVLVGDLKPLVAGAPLAGSSPALTGFVKGEQLIVSIGTIRANGHFSSLWAAVINVK